MFWVPQISGTGASFLGGIEMSFLWYRSTSLLGIEILHSVVRHRDRLLPGINPCLFFWALTSCKNEIKEDRDTEKKIE